MNTDTLRPFESYDINFAAYAMGRGLRLLGLSQNTEGRFTFFFDALAIQDAMKAWRNNEAIDPRSLLGAQTYLRQLMRSQGR